jgi:hypothetical protein
MASRPKRALLVAGLLAALALVLAPAPAAAATVAFGTPVATATFGQGVDFRQPVTITGGVSRVELLVTEPGAPGPAVRVVAADQGATTLRYTLEADKGGLLPNTPLSGQWRVLGADGSTSLGPPVTVRYDDTRFAWQTQQSGIVRLHWYEGTAEFANRALQVGTRAIDSASRLLGVTETDPVDIFVYAGQTPFYDALGPGTRENVGGQANAEIRTLFALITPADITAPWVQTVITHELTHLVFDTAVSNPYHFPPRWLNEGLAVYLAQGYNAGDRSSVEAAAASGSLMPLAALAYQFPTTRDRFALAYAESVAAVDYLIRAHGEDALVALIRSYAGGVTDDEAFRAGVGQDVPAFDAAWRQSLRAREPIVYGPQPAPAGPLPAGWTGSSATPPPNAAAPTTPGAGGAPGGPTVIVVPAIVALIGLLILVRRRSTRHRLVAPPTGPADDASSPPPGPPS